VKFEYSTPFAAFCSLVGADRKGKPKQGSCYPASKLLEYYSNFKIQETLFSTIQDLVAPPRDQVVLRKADGVLLERSRAQPEKYS